MTVQKEELLNSLHERVVMDWDATRHRYMVDVKTWAIRACIHGTAHVPTPDASKGFDINSPTMFCNEYVNDVDGEILRDSLQLGITQTDYVRMCISEGKKKGKF